MMAHKAFTRCYFYKVRCGGACFSFLGRLICVNGVSRHAKMTSVSIPKSIVFYDGVVVNCPCPLYVYVNMCVLL
jgi:hypothetical protein